MGFTPSHAFTHTQKQRSHTHGTHALYQDRPLLEMDTLDPSWLPAHLVAGGAKDRRSVKSLGLGLGQGQGQERPSREKGGQLLSASLALLLVMRQGPALRRCELAVLRKVW